MPVRAPAMTPDGGVPSVRPPPSRSSIPTTATPLPPSSSGVRAVQLPPQMRAPRPAFYSIHANDVPRVASKPPPRRTFFQRVRAAVLLLALPTAAGFGTYFGLVHHAAPPSYVFVANAGPSKVELSVDGKPQGMIEPGGSARIDMPRGQHAIKVADPSKGVVVDSAMVKMDPGARLLFNVSGAASLAVVTRGYGASAVDRVLPVPPGRLVPLPPDVSGTGIDVPFPATVSAPAGESSATLSQLCSYDALKRTVGCPE
jgi:hypothetical protein